jgi:hypothetical protein
MVMSCEWALVEFGVGMGAGPVTLQVTGRNAMADTTSSGCRGQIEAWQNRVI